MNAAPFPYNDPESWQVVIGSRFLSMKTLIIDVKGLKTKNKSDKAGGLGRDFGSIRHKGRELGAFTMHFLAWEENGWQELDGLFRWAYSLADRTEDDMAVVVYHPTLDTRNINKMYIDELEGPEFDRAAGKMRGSWACSQWAPSPKTNKAVTVKAADVPDALMMKRGGAKSFDVPKKTPLPGKSGKKPSP